jgi:hypothetical protein
MRVRRRPTTDWQRVEALKRDGYGLEDIVVILRDEAIRGRRAVTVTPEQIRTYIIRGIKS